MNIEQAAIQILSGDVLLHVDMIENIKRGTAVLLQVNDQGVLLMNTSCGTYMMSAEDEKTAGQMIGSVKSARMFVAHQDFYIDSIKEKFSLKKKMVCYQAAYLSKEFLPKPGYPIEVKQLDGQYLSLIKEHYSYKMSDRYLRERLKSGVMYGAFVEGNLAGFTGIHSEGAMGMLEVFPEYRRRGVAAVLASYHINEHLVRGYIPFVQIVEGNTASLKLQAKLNLSISDKKIYWLM